MQRLCTCVCMYLYVGACVLVCRERLSWIRMTRTAWQDGRRLGKEDAGHSLFFPYKGCSRGPILGTYSDRGF